MYTLITPSSLIITRDISGQALDQGHNGGGAYTRKTKRKKAKDTHNEKEKARNARCTNMHRGTEGRFNSSNGT